MRGRPRWVLAQTSLHVQRDEEEHREQRRRRAEHERVAQSDVRATDHGRRDQRDSPRLFADHECDAESECDPSPTNVRGRSPAVARGLDDREHQREQRSGAERRAHEAPVRRRSVKHVLRGLCELRARA